MILRCVLQWIQWLCLNDSICHVSNNIIIIQILINILAWVYCCLLSLFIQVYAFPGLAGVIYFLSDILNPETACLFVTLTLTHRIRDIPRSCVIMSTHVSSKAGRYRRLSKYLYRLGQSKPQCLSRGYIDTCLQNTICLIWVYLLQNCRIFNIFTSALNISFGIMF